MSRRTSEKSTVLSVRVSDELRARIDDQCDLVNRREGVPVTRTQMVTLLLLSGLHAREKKEDHRGKIHDHDQ